MTVRSRLHRVIGLCFLVPAISGCSDSFLAGKLHYVENEALTKDVKGRSSLVGKPRLQEKVRKALADIFGEDPQRIRVPEAMGGLLNSGGAYLGNYQVQDGVVKHSANEDPVTKQFTRYAGGYGIYRRQCLHCHGVSGAGDGPTAPFLYPYPRDYRKGLFKFTSTPNGARPSKEDLKRTVRNGLNGTSMPAFHSLLSDFEIDQVVDYVIFLSIRGETELALIDEGAISDETDINALSPETAAEIADGVIRRWIADQSKVVNPTIARTESTRESILRGRELFLGKTPEKLECSGCHGLLARGDGKSFVPQDVFNQVVFGGNPSERQQRIDALSPEMKDLWGQKLDDWGNPLRPANLNRGKDTVYKGGRRPIDIYWRIAKGITGAQMPAHYPTIDEKKVWDLVNFVLALPFEPELLGESPHPGGPEVPPGVSGTPPVAAR
ncbi:Cytochrome c [Aquisphaera giovannonii]|uniref:Cytochrome c n=1 Tax=Aquisphaera giovannonii TaxID=406548 RepID=A0A5B9W256_9BACT|nr:cytochrome c [Aquisphaera giovannonii]QEH34070.1 Cytochrome c [Aquisphaera giovannonii]